MHINLSFLEDFRPAMLEERKTATSRTRKYGSPGDTFAVFGATFVIVEVFQQRLSEVKNELYKAEGCPTPAAFECIYTRLHPRVGFQPDKVVYVHIFKRIDKLL